MRLPILLVAFLSTSLARPDSQRSTRTPQAHVRYNDPNGLKVDWKYFTPPSQPQPQLLASQRAEREQPLHPQQTLEQQPLQSPQDPEHQIQYKTYSQVQAPLQAQPEVNQVQYQAYTQAQIPGEAQPEINQVQYKAYTQAQFPVEADLNQVSYKQYSETAGRQLIAENSKQQRPYVDQSPILYNPNFAQQFEQQSANAELSQYQRPSANAELSQYQRPSANYEPADQQKSRRDYSTKGLQGRIVYKNEQPRQQQLSQIVHVPVLVENIPTPPPPRVIVDKSMPPEIQQLLQFQAQLPYTGIANSITYKRPKTLFFPEPLPEDGKGPYSYRTRTYYVHNDQYQPILETKPVHEDQRH